jgi:tetratricopeptide (TPR) repeat protein
MRRILSTALILVVHVFPCAVQATLPVPPELERLADVVMAGRSPEEVRSAALAALDSIANLPDQASRYVHEAQRLFLLGFDALGRGDTGQGESYLEASIAAARASLQVEETSEGYRVLADGHNQLLKTRGRAYKVLNFRAARSMVDQAVALDGDNPLAHVTAAGYYLSAPRIAGGDVLRGLEHVEAAARLNADNRYVSFMVAVWTAWGEAETGNPESARRALARAEAIYPDNWLLAEVRGDLGLQE